MTEQLTSTITEQWVFSFGTLAEYKLAITIAEKALGENFKFKMTRKLLLEGVLYRDLLSCHLDDAGIEYKLSRIEAPAK
ncbi:MAG: hypothetical protein ACRDBG_21240 [Waterburya sp.]